MIKHVFQYFQVSIIIYKKQKGIIITHWTAGKEKRIKKYVFLIFPENKIWPFMQIVSKNVLLVFILMNNNQLYFNE